MKNSNVAIDQNTNEILTEFCSKIKLTKKDFISFSLKYFNDYSINPAKHEKPTVEIEKMHKRIEDLIKFSRSQERDVLKPFFDNIITTLGETSQDSKNIIESIIVFNQNRIKQLDEIKSIHSKELNFLKEENIKIKSEVFEANKNIKLIVNGVLSMNKELSKKLKIIVDNQNAGMTGKKQTFE
ncbi:MULTISPECIES: BfmA/BtgA family mobilization protein [unclassified Flavobacterium]|jgi:hypothetical protein|uniref:BfmA/BtgA family mobilization protein n=1 Tax=unclassified Flavobacterium TaxID=196869 RepID=UPI00131CC209|nr:MULTISPECIES: BfmA/BtgA family mobilization protein [unclassified Flavobacterium]